MKHTLYLLFFAFAFLTSCHKEQAILPNGLNGCDCANEVSAEFYIEEMTTPNPNFVKYTDTDTIYGNRNVRFKATENDAEYTWYIGAEVIHTHELLRYFPSSMNGQTVLITLVVKKKPNNICFPNDDGYDSITKSLTIVQNNVYDGTGTIHFEGQYKVKSPLLTDSTIITLDYFIKNSAPYYTYFNIINYDGLDSDCIDEFGQALSFDAVNYAQIWFESPVVSIGNSLNGNIKLDNGKIELNIRTGAVFSNGILSYTNNWNYKGRKI
jgi:hypothetical protein